MGEGKAEGDGGRTIGRILREDELAAERRARAEAEEKLAAMGSKDCPACGTRWEKGEGKDMPEENAAPAKAKRKAKAPPEREGRDDAPAPAPAPAPAQAPADDDDDGDDILGFFGF